MRNKLLYVIGVFISTSIGVLLSHGSLIWLGILSVIFVIVSALFYQNNDN